MKTPTDVFNTMKVVLAHIEDLKNLKMIDTHTPSVLLAVGKKPIDVFAKTVEIIDLLNKISRLTKVPEAEIPRTPQEVLPRDCFTNAILISQQLVRIKRRLGAQDRATPVKATVAVSPSHVFSETEKIYQELTLLLSLFEREFR